MVENVMQAREEIHEEQIHMTQLVWKSLQSHGVTDSTQLLIAIFWLAPNENAAQMLKGALVHEMNTPVKINYEDSRWAVEGQVGPKNFDLDSLLEFIKHMINIGSSNGCELKCWCAKAPAIAKKLHKPFWKFWN